MLILYFPFSWQFLSVYDPLFRKSCWLDRLAVMGKLFILLVFGPVSRQSPWLDILAARGKLLILSVWSTLHTVFLARWIRCKGKMLIVNVVAHLPAFLQNFLGLSEMQGKVKTWGFPDADVPAGFVFHGCFSLNTWVLLQGSVVCFSGLVFLCQCRVSS